MQASTRNDKIIEALVVSASLNQYVLFEGHDALGHIGTMEIFYYFKLLYYWKGLGSDEDQSVRKCVKCESPDKLFELRDPYACAL